MKDTEVTELKLENACAKNKNKIKWWHSKQINHENKDKIAALNL